MKKLIKIAVILVLALVVLVGAGITILLMNVNSLAKKGIESGGTYAMGVPTKVDSVSLSILGGSMSLSGLDVANPSGFKSPHFLNLKSGDIAVSINSLNKNVVEIPKLALNGIDVNLERGPDGFNYAKIIDNLKKLKSSGASKPTSAGDKKFVIRELTIDNTNVHAAPLGAPGQIGQVLNSAAKMDVLVDHIQLNNVGSAGSGIGGSGVTMEELAGIIVQAVLAAAADKGGGIIPGDILGDLKGAVSSLGGLEHLGADAVNDAGKVIQDAGKNIADGIGGLLGGKKDEKKNPPKKP